MIVVYVTGPELLTFIGVTAPTPDDSEWARLCADAVNDGIAHFLDLPEAEPATRANPYDLRYLLSEIGVTPPPARHMTFDTDVIANVRAVHVNAITTGHLNVHWLISELGEADYVTIRTPTGPITFQVTAYLSGPTVDHTEWVTWPCTLTLVTGAQLPPVGTELSNVVQAEPAPALDPELVAAARMCAGELYRRRDAPFGTTGFTDLQTGGLIRLARDYLEGVKPILARQRYIGGLVA